jgi:hypothetical protein
MTQAQISGLIDTYQQDHAKGLLTQQQLLALVWRLDRRSYSQSNARKNFKGHYPELCQTNTFQTDGN